jgi:hypothetical protein
MKLNIKNNIIRNNLNKLLNNLLIALTINRSFFKGSIKFFILLLIGIIASIFIRIDYNIHWLNIFPEWISLLIKFTSAIYTCFIWFTLIILLKQVKDYIILHYSTATQNNQINKTPHIFISIIYYIYNSFIIFITWIISYINYWSINLLNIDGLNELFLFSILMSILLGISLSLIFKSNFNLNNNKNFNFIFKLLLASSILCYIILFIAIRYPNFIEWLKEFNWFNKVYCDSTGDSENSLNNRLRSDETGNEISNNSNLGSHLISSYSGNSNSVNIGNNTTASNININPSPINTNPSITATRTVSTTETIITPVATSTVNNPNNNPLIGGNNNDNPPCYSNNPNDNPNNNSLIEKGKQRLIESVGIFNSPMKSSVSLIEFAKNNPSIESINNNPDIYSIKNNPSIDSKSIDSNNNPVTHLFMKIKENLNKLEESKRDIKILSEQLKYINMDKEILYKELLKFLNDSNDPLNNQHMTLNALKFLMGEVEINNLFEEKSSTNIYSDINTSDSRFFFNPENNQSNIQEIDSNINYNSDNSGSYKTIQTGPVEINSIDLTNQESINSNIEESVNVSNTEKINITDKNKKVSILKKLGRKISNVFKK